MHTRNRVREVLGRPYGHIENIKHRMHEIDELMASGQNLGWNAIATEYADLELKLKSTDIGDEKTLLYALTQVGLNKDFVDRYMDTLSGGQRCRVAPQEIDNFQWAIDQDKIRKTGGRQRKKVSIKEKKKDDKI